MFIVGRVNQSYNSYLLRCHLPKFSSSNNQNVWICWYFLLSTLSTIQYYTLPLLAVEGFHSLHGSITNCEKLFKWNIFIYTISHPMVPDEHWTHCWTTPGHMPTIAILHLITTHSFIVLLISNTVNGKDLLGLTFAVSALWSFLRKYFCGALASSVYYLTMTISIHGKTFMVLLKSWKSSPANLSCLW